jgi:phosphoadenosine phosphosulfate reductase
MIDADSIAVLNQDLAGQPTERVLRWAWERFGSRAALGTSFQGAGLVLMDLAVRHGLPIPVFTLDTGLLFPETLALKGRLEAHYGITIETLQPDLSVEQQAAAHGPALWARDPDLCCTMRKVLPLQGRLATLDCWITGIRRDQSGTRAEADLVEVYVADPETGREIVKLNPMAAWSRKAVWSYVRERGIPYNPLHDLGYHSIGCQPCTVLAGNVPGERAGRWVGFQKTECGIHTFLQKRA